MMPYGPGRWCYDCNFSHKPEDCGSKPSNYCEACQKYCSTLTAHTCIPVLKDVDPNWEPGKPLFLRPKGASMYQIYLVIKEDMKDEIGSMLVQGFDSLSEAAEQMLVNFERLQDANELSNQIDKQLKDLLEITDEEWEKFVEDLFN